KEYECQNALVIFSYFAYLLLQLHLLLVTYALHDRSYLLNFQSGSVRQRAFLSLFVHSFFERGSMGALLSSINIIFSSLDICLISYSRCMARSFVGYDSDNFN